MIPPIMVGGVRVRVHGGLVVLLALAVYARLGAEAAVFAAVLLGHELAHILMAAAFNLRVTDLELLPTGGVARVEGLETADPGVEAVVALAGPLHNLLCLAGGFLLRAAGALAPGRGDFFLLANAALAAGNLLPALPLDGGRVVRAALALHRGARAATAWVTRAGLAVGGAMLAAAAGLLALRIVAPGLLVFGACIVLRARGGREDVGMRPWREMGERSAGIGILPVRVLACGPSMRLREVVTRFLPRHYHLVWVVAGGGKAVGPWDEAAVWRALRSHGADAAASVLRGEI